MASGNFNLEKRELIAKNYSNSSPQKDDFKAEVFALIGRGQMGSLIASILQKNFRAETLILHSQSTQNEWNQCQRADLLIDFSHASAVERNCEVACRFKKPLIVGTTGWDEVAKGLKKRVLDAQIPCLHSPNFSWGIFALRKALHQIASFSSLLNISNGSLSETHGMNKADSPSGTAKQLARDVADLFGIANLKICSERTGNDPGRHHLALDASDEIIELRHIAKSRRGFAFGAIASSRWLLHQQPGWYTMDDQIESINAQNKNRHQTLGDLQ